MLQEIMERDLLLRLEKAEDKMALLFYTPLCGTCLLAERMMEIAEESGTNIPGKKININFAPVLRDEWQISSVPCLIVTENGIPVLKEYAIGSVVDVHRWLNS
ncbi:thioredoxin family protein [Paenibacillus vini]|uniref:Thioredoxin domain-containing protein n=1 Tax=Paenibacillus vini TaxID=1476024 RepID=A0ABQ4MBC9_9BACL|nr:thioredoxin family protein [Paenibacillus vini]GIP52735.1 hypothetical protein J42TS3_17700 [Paenibacillus vini]